MIDIVNAELSVGRNAPGDSKARSGFALNSPEELDALGDRCPYIPERGGKSCLNNRPHYNDQGKAAPLRLTPIDDIFDQVNEMYNAIARRAFEIFDGRGRQSGNDLDDWTRAESELFHPAHLDISETDDAFTVHAEVPGFRAEELHVSLEARRLTIIGNRQAEGSPKQSKTIYRESCCNEIFRALDLPADVDASKATAALKDGLLELTLPKAAPARKIPVEPKVA